MSRPVTPPPRGPRGTSPTCVSATGSPQGEKDKPRLSHRRQRICECETAGSRGREPCEVSLTHERERAVTGVACTR